jgi:hypothetical protein
LYSEMEISMPASLRDESFAGVLLIAQGSSASPDGKLTINGGSTAIGHPRCPAGADAH